MDTTKDSKAEEESRSVAATTAEYGQEGEEDEEYDGDYYYEDEYEDGMSGDFEMPAGKDESSLSFSSSLCLLL